MKALCLAFVLLFSATVSAEHLSESPSVVLSELSAVSAQELTQVLGSGAELTLHAVETSAGVSVAILEGGSDGARFSIAVSADVAGVLVQLVGGAVEMTVDAAGTALCIGGTMLAYLPNEASGAMLHRQKL